MFIFVLSSFLPLFVARPHQQPEREGYIAHRFPIQHRFKCLHLSVCRFEIAFDSQCTEYNPMQSEVTINVVYLETLYIVLKQAQTPIASYYVSQTRVYVMHCRYLDAFWDLIVSSYLRVFFWVLFPVGLGRFSSSLWLCVRFQIFDLREYFLCVWMAVLHLYRLGSTGTWPHSSKF